MPYQRLAPITVAGIWFLCACARVSGQTPLPEPGVLKLGATPLAAPNVPLNQRTADAIAARLRDSGVMRHYSIDVTFQNGVAYLNGRVASDAQREQAVNIVRTVDGVEVVQERLLVENRQPLEPVQALGPLPMPEYAPQQPVPVPWTNPMQNMRPAPPMPGVGTAPMAGMNAGPAAGATNFQEPEPIFKATSPGFDTTLQPPLMPPYAWPTYAPYNNYSRVAYPTLYPYEAWPFIGPCYPFPKVPLGWRSVTLSWQDGYWWYGKNATGHDWWRIRYW